MHELNVLLLITFLGENFFIFNKRDI